MNNKLEGTGTADDSAAVALGLKCTCNHTTLFSHCGGFSTTAWDIVVCCLACSSIHHMHDRDMTCHLLPGLFVVCRSCAVHIP
jgi:hypothetical protein